MPLYTSNATQLVGSGDNVTFDNAPCHSLFAYHRRGGGSVLIFRPGVYQVTFSANVTDTSATADTSVSFAVTENGNSISSATSVVTVGSDAEIENLHAKTLVAVPRGASVSVGARNLSTDSITVTNASLIVEVVRFV